MEEGHQNQRPQKKNFKKNFKKTYGNNQQRPEKKTYIKAQDLKKMKREEERNMIETLIRRSKEEAPESGVNSLYALISRLTHSLTLEKRSKKKIMKLKSLQRRTLTSCRFLLLH